MENNSKRIFFKGNVVSFFIENIFYVEKDYTEEKTFWRNKSKNRTYLIRIRTEPGFYKYIYFKNKDERDKEYERIIKLISKYSLTWKN